VNPHFADLRGALFRGFADRNRLRIIEQLAIGGEQRVVDVVRATGLAQPNVSAHLACLWACGLVERERRGREVHYRLTDGVTELLDAADAILDRTGERVDTCKNYGNGRREAAA
jgi:DNA-binding transcriptional ArsR family regulator